LKKLHLDLGYKIDYELLEFIVNRIIYNNCAREVSEASKEFAWKHFSHTSRKRHIVYNCYCSVMKPSKEELCLVYTLNSAE